MWWLMIARKFRWRVTGNYAPSLAWYPKYFTIRSTHLCLDGSVSELPPTNRKTRAKSAGLCRYTKKQLLLVEPPYLTERASFTALFSGIARALKVKHEAHKRLLIPRACVYLVSEWAIQTSRTIVVVFWWNIVWQAHGDVLVILSRDLRRHLPCRNCLMSFSLDRICICWHCGLRAIWVNRPNAQIYWKNRNSTADYTGLCDNPSHERNIGLTKNELSCVTRPNTITKYETGYYRPSP